MKRSHIFLVSLLLTSCIMLTPSTNAQSIVYNGFSNYPYPLTTSATQEVIDLMEQHNLNVYRMSCRPSYSEGSHPYEKELVQYYLDNTPNNWIIIVDANHIVNNPKGTTDALARWDSHIKPRIKQVIDDFPNEPRVWVELFNELYVNFDTYYSRAQDLIDYVESLSLSYYPVLVVNKLYTSGYNWKVLEYSKNDIYDGYHFYFQSSSDRAKAFKSMQKALGLGIKVLNTEIGANSGSPSEWTQSQVDALQQFHSECANIGAENCVWLSWGTGWYSELQSFGYDFDNPSQDIQRYKLTIVSSGFSGGTTDPPPGTYMHDYGTQVTVEAVLPWDGTVELEWWKIDGVLQQPSPSVTVTMNQDHSVEASFQLVSEKYNCFYCDDVFDTEAELLDHMLIHAPKTQTYRCLDCKEVFSFTPPWSIVIEDKVGKIVISPLAPTCPVCGSENVRLRGNGIIVSRLSSAR